MKSRLEKAGFCFSVTSAYCTMQKLLAYDTVVGCFRTAVGLQARLYSLMQI
jgi:hypothetical protein